MMSYFYRVLSCQTKRIIAFLMMAFVFSPTVASAAWPDRTVTIVVPFSAGGATDIVARLVGQKLSEKWGQSVVVDNKLGAGGNIGTGIVARANPDGYTLLMASGANLTINPHLYSNLPFDVQRDFAPVTNVANGPMVVATSTNVKAKNLQEFIDDARKNPDRYNLGSAGMGSQGHLAGENFQHAADIKLMHVPYRGEAAAFADLLAGQIDVVVGNIGAVTGLVGSGRINVLAVTSKDRSPSLPDVATAGDSGLPGFQNYGWFGFAAPAGTDPAIISKIHQDVKAVLETDDIITRLAELGMAPLANTPEEFSKQIVTESKQWKTVIDERKISLD